MDVVASAHAAARTKTLPDPSGLLGGREEKGGAGGVWQRLGSRFDLTEG
jgi:hypothetical protein